MNNFAIDTKGIGVALQRSAASFNAAGTSLEKSVALLTTTNAVLQNPETTGTLYKTLSARIRGAKTELEELGEETDTYVESTSKLRDLVKGMTGFDILKEDEKTYKDIYDILLGISEVWGKLSDIDQAALAEALAGKRTANGLYAVLQNPEDLKRAYASALNSEGSAAKEQENWSKSIQYSVDQMKAASEQLQSDFIKSDWIKSAIELLTKLIELLDKLAVKDLAIPALLLGGGSRIFNGKISDIRQAILNGSGGFLAKGTSVIDSDARESFLKSYAKSKNYRNVQTLLTQDPSIGAKADAYATKTVGGGLGVLGKTAVMAGVIALAAGAYKLATAEKEAAKEAQAVGEQYKKSSGTIDDYKEKAENLYRILQNDNSTNEEKYNARQELYKLQKDMIDKYPEEAKGIQLVADSYKEQEKALRDLTALKQKDWENAQIDFDSKKTFWESLLNGNTTRTEDIRNQMEKASQFISVQDIIDPEATKEIRNMGINITDPDTSGQIITINGSLQEVYDKLVSLNNYAKKNNLGASLITDLSKAIAESKTKLEEYKDYYDADIYNEQILGNSEYENLFTQYSAAYERYTDAIASGDAKAKETAIQQFGEIFSQLPDGPIKEWFQNLYPDLAQIVSNWEFEVNFNVNKDGLKSRVFKDLGTYLFESEEDFLNYTDNGTNSNKDNAIRDVDFLANQYGITREEILNLFRENGGKLNTGARNQYEESLKKYSNEDRESIASFTKDFTDEQIRQWLDVTKYITDADQAIQKYTNSVIKSSKTKIAPKDTIDNLNTLNDGFDVLADIYKDVQDGGDFDFSKLDTKKFSENFEGLDKEYAEFIAEVSKSPKDIKKCQDAFNKLTSAYIDHNIKLENIDESTVDVVKSMLEMYGVTNAQEVADAYLTRAQEQLNVENEVAQVKVEAYKESAEGLVGLSYDRAAALAVEREATNAATMAIAQEIATEKIFNSTTLSVAGKVSELTNLAQAFLGTAAAAKIASYSLEGTPGADDDLETAWNKMLNQKSKITIPTIEYGGAKTPKDSGGGSSGSEASEKEYDFRERYLSNINKLRTESTNIIEDENVAYSEQLSKINDLLSADDQLIQAYSQLAELARNTANTEIQNIHNLFDAQFGKEYVDELIERFKNGSIDFTKWHEEFTKGAKGEISKAQEEALSDLQTALEDVDNYEEQYAEATRQRIADIIKEYEIRVNQIQSAIDGLDAKASMVQDRIDLYQTTGQEILTEGDYKSLIALSEKSAEKYKDQLEVLYDELDALESQGAEGSSQWYSVKSQINDVNSSIRECQKSQADWNEEIKNLPVQRLDRYLELLENIRNTITRFSDTSETLGNLIDKDQVDLEIGIILDEFQVYSDKAQELEKNLSTYTYGTDKFNETANAIDDCKNGINDLINRMIELTKAFIDLPLQQLDVVTEKLNTVKDAIQLDKDEYEFGINGVVSYLSDEIESVNDSYEKRIEKLREGTAEEEAQLSVERAKLALEKARGENTQKILKDGQWAWSQDIAEVKAAEKELEDAVREKAIADLETERDAIIKALETTQQKWSELIDSIQKLIDYSKVTALFGDEWQAIVRSGNDGKLFELAAHNYEKDAVLLDEFDKQIEDNNLVASGLRTLNDMLLKGAITNEEYQERSQALILAAQDGLSASENLAAILSVYGQTDAVKALDDLRIEGFTIKDSIKDNYDTVNRYMDLIRQRTDSINELTANINKNLEELKNKREEEIQKVAAPSNVTINVHNYGNDDDGGSPSSSSGNWYDKYTGPGNGITSEQFLKTYSSNGGDVNKTLEQLGIKTTGHKTGIANGVVGSIADLANADGIRALALEPLSPDEVLSTLHVGEAVLNQAQMGNLFNNVRGAVNSLTPSKSSAQRNITVNFGGITIAEANNITDIAHGIMNGGLAQAITQELYKR